MSMKCGHCGSEVNDGFKVCSGCGAHYRSNFKVFFGGIFLVFIGFSVVPDYLIAGLIAIGIGGLYAYQGGRRKWYRYNP